MDIKMTFKPKVKHVENKIVCRIRQGNNSQHAAMKEEASMVDKI